MNANKLLKTVSRFLSANKKKQNEHTKCFKEVLHKLKKKERQLKNELEHEKNEKTRKRIKKDLEVVYVQRRKGIQALKKLKNGQ